MTSPVRAEQTGSPGNYRVSFVSAFSHVHCLKSLLEDLVSKSLLEDLFLRISPIVFFVSAKQVHLRDAPGAA